MRVGMRAAVALLAVMFSLVAGVSSARADPDLLGEWHLDQIVPCSSCVVTSSSTPDSSGRGNDLGFLGTGAPGELISDGRFANAFRFDGGGTGLPVGTSSSLQPQQVTVLAWVRAAQSPGLDRYLVALGADACTGSSYALYTGGTGGLSFYVRSGSASFVISPDAGVALWDGSWHAVAGTYDGATVRLYVDGHQVGAGTAGPAAIAYTSDRTFELGGYPQEQACGTGTNARYVGDLDEVRVYDRALSASEVNYLQTSPAAAPPELPLPSLGLTVSRTGAGSGTVTSQPPGVSCGGSCTASYPYGTTVALTATADPGSTFAGWSGDCSGTGTCNVTMNQARTVTATFDHPVAPTFVLNVSRTGSGSGTVTGQPSGISCGTACSASFASGTRVTLTASAAPGSSFTGWSGDCSGTGSCTVTMSQNRNVTAGFGGPAPVHTKLEFKGCIGANPGCRPSNPRDALRDLNDIVVTPDGNNLYAGGEFGISHFKIDSGGNLTFDGCIGNTSGCRSTRPAIGNVDGLVVSPDGRDLYAASEGGFSDGSGASVSHLTIDGAGNLRFAGCIGAASGCTQLPFDALPQPRGIAMSPGGSHLYVTSGTPISGTSPNAGGDLATFTVDSAGTPRFVGCTGTVNGCRPTNPALDFYAGGSVTLTPNGTHLYVGAGFIGAVSEFAIDAQGNPEFRGCIGGSVGGCSSSPTSGGWHLAVAPNGKELYASEPSGPGAVAFYRIDSAGALTFDGCIGKGAACSTPTGGPDALFDAYGLAISPDGDHLYIGGLGDLSDLPIDSAGNVGFAGCIGAQDHTFNDCTLPPGAPDALSGLTYAVAVRPGGRDIYAGTSNDGAVSHFRIGGSFIVRKALIVGLVETHKVFVVGKPFTPIKGVTAATQQRPPTGTVFSFTLNQPATVTIAIQGEKPGRRARGKCQKPTSKLKHSRACTRHVTIFTLTRTAHAGLNKVPFTGRIRGTALTPGRYQAAFSAINKAGHSRVKAIRFTIVKP